MKKTVAIGLLLLLCFNMFGVSLATLLFDKFYQHASPISYTDEWKEVKIYLPSLPYNSSWENQEGQAGLIRHDDDFYNITYQKHENDTLYTRLKTNEDARYRFAELSGMIQNMLENSAANAETPLSKAVKSLTDLLKLYLPTVNLPFPTHTSYDIWVTSNYPNLDQYLLDFPQLLHLPPPELVF